MAAILYDFPGVPGERDERMPHDENGPWKDVRYRGIYEDLKARGLRLPSEPHDVISRDALVSHLQILLGEVVGHELAHDPDFTYAKGKSHAEHAAAFMAHQHDHRGVEVRGSRMSLVLAGFPHGPNHLTGDDIAAARRGR